MLKGDQRVGFQLGSYDRERTLVIDPVLVYSTYLGGSSDDRGKGIAVDTEGNVYVTGVTSSTDFPTVNAFQTGIVDEDTFVAKLDPTGSSLLYSTYLGGRGGDHGHGIAVDGAGNAYVTGLTWSDEFPTVNALKPAFEPPNDAFVAKLDASGSNLLYFHLPGRQRR